MRHLAWLGAVPDSTTPAVTSEKVKPKTRRDVMEAKHIVPDMPEIECGFYLIGYLWDCGPVMRDGAGAYPLTHAELAHWQANSGVELLPWESKALRRMSGEYLAEQQAATDPLRPAPYDRSEAAQVLHAAEMMAREDAFF